MVGWSVFIPPANTTRGGILESADRWLGGQSFIPPANTTRGGILESADRWLGGQSFCKMLSQNPPKVVKASK